jgi:hypothetical protein
MVLKRKTDAQYRNLSVGQKQFSINGTRRLQGFIGQNIISRSFPKTIMRGTEAQGYGGCCGKYYKGVSPISPLCAGDFTNDPSVVKKSVLSNDGQLELRYRPEVFTTTKPDDGHNKNTSQEHTKLKAALITNCLKPYCIRTGSTTLRLDYNLIQRVGTNQNLPQNTEVYATVTWVQNHVISEYSLQNYYTGIPSWIKDITLYVKINGVTTTYSNFNGVYILLNNAIIDYSQTNLLSQFHDFLFTDNISNYLNGYNTGIINNSTMRIGRLNTYGYDAQLRSIQVIIKDETSPKQSTCNNPLFTGNKNYQQRSKRCPTFTTKDAFLYSSVSSSEYTESLQQQTANQDAEKKKQGRISNCPPFGSTVPKQPFDKTIANHYDKYSRNFYLNSVRVLQLCHPDKPC